MPLIVLVTNCNRPANVVTCNKLTSFLNSVQSSYLLHMFFKFTGVGVALDAIKDIEKISTTNEDEKIGFK